MRKSSTWLRFCLFLGFSISLFTSLWLFNSAETPPWRQTRAPDLKPPEKLVSHPETREADSAFSPFSFLTYNVKNWLSSSQNPEKTTESKNAVIKIIAASNPDIIGLSEIGSEADLHEIREMLKASGCNLPFYHHTGGIDPIRHLAILSRYPIISSEKSEIKITGTKHSMQRGILDVTIQIKNTTARFIGLHLKSKRVVPSFDQASLRLLEAEHTRKLIDEILNTKPNTLLTVYGDFNDHIHSLSTKALLGKYHSPLYLTPVKASDQSKESWTHFYKTQDSYSRIDFVTLSKKLKPHLNKKQTRILDDPDWNIASDHRAVIVSFK